MKYGANITILRKRRCLALTLRVPADIIRQSSAPISRLGLENPHYNRTKNKKKYRGDVRAALVVHSGVRAGLEKSRRI